MTRRRLHRFAPAACLVLLAALLATSCANVDGSNVDDVLGGEPEDPLRDSRTDPRETPSAPEFQSCLEQVDCPYSNSICLAENGPGFCTVSCQQAGDCPGNHSCDAGVCHPVCLQDVECPTGYGCEGGLCVGLGGATAPLPGGGDTTEPDDTPDDPGPGTVDPNPTDDPDPTTQPPITNFGGPCQTAPDCLNGEIDPNVLCLSQVPGGYCTIACVADGECGDTASCALELSVGQTFCGLDCSVDADCGRAGQVVCGLDLTPPVCVGDTGSDPPDPTPGEDPLSFGELGAACSTDLDCSVGSLSDNRCFTDGQGWPQGYCTGYGCSSDADCGPDSLCATDPDGFGLCVRACTDTCGRSGYDCLPISETEGLCLPDLPDPLLDPPNVGAPCTITDQCTMGNGDTNAPFRFCIPPQWPDGALGILDGYCTAVDCSLAGADCGSGGTCVVFPEDPNDPTDSDLYLCLESCPGIGGRSSCRSGYFCYDDGLGQGVCWEEG